MSEAVTWTATTSDGQTIVEHTGEYQIIPGERKPWVRLCHSLARGKQHLVNLKIEFEGQTISVPGDASKFPNIAKYSRAPLSYSLQYMADIEYEDGGFQQTDYVDLVAHYEDHEVHSVVNLQNAHVWIIETQDMPTMAQTPDARLRHT